jgi:hypothetical protein
MRRILLLMAVAVMMLAVSVSPALAQTTDIPPPGRDPAGDPHTPDTNVANPTDLQGQNCYGQDASNFNKGPGPSLSPTSDEPFPGSAVEPVQFGGQENFNGPAHKQFVQTDEEPGGGNPISDFQQTTREDLAACGQTA